MKSEAFIWGCLLASVLFNCIMMKRMLNLEFLFDELLKQNIRLADIIEHFQKEWKR